MNTQPFTHWVQTMQSKAKEKETVWSCCSPFSRKSLEAPGKYPLFSPLVFGGLGIWQHPSLKQGSICKTENAFLTRKTLLGDKWVHCHGNRYASHYEVFLMAWGKHFSFCVSSDSIQSWMEFWGGISAWKQTPSCHVCWEVWGRIALKCWQVWLVEENMDNISFLLHTNRTLYIT